MQKAGLRWEERGAVLLLLLALALQAAWSATRDSATYDETAHIVAGLSYLETGDFRLNPEHPPLAKMWSALPLLFESGRQVPTSGHLWQRARQWELGFEYINGPIGASQRRDPTARLVPARLMMVVLGLLLALCVFGWSRDIWGVHGAFVSLVFCAFSPTILAHTRLVTTDVPVALAIVGALWAWSRFAASPSWPRVCWLGLTMAGALLTKFSALILAPILVVLAVMWVGRWPLPARVTRVRWVVRGGALVALVVVVSVWAVYGFRYQAAPGLEMPWHLTGISRGLASQTIQVFKDWHLLPESYLYGLAYVAGHAGGRATYLNGQVLSGGSWAYFPVTFLYKTTPAVLAACAWLVGRALTRGRVDARVLQVLIPLTMLVALDLGSDLNIGHRHLVPIYPLLFVLAGGLVATRLTARRRLVLVVLLFSQAASAASAFPGYLSYFNWMAGGSGGGGRYLSDSNIDWGQDLPRLASWLERNRVDSIDLAYFGTADPAAYGIRFRPLYMVYDFDGRSGRLPTPESGRYVAVSHTLLQGLHVADPAIGAFLSRVRSTLTPVGKAGESILIFRMP